MADRREFVERSFGLRHEGFYMGVTGVVGSRETWLGPLSGHVFKNIAAECGDDRALFAALKEATEQDSHPLPCPDAFPVTKVNLFVRDLGVE